jgi:hypothetical protein
MTFFLTVLFMIFVYWRPQEWLMPWMLGFPILDVIVFISLLFLLVDIDGGRVRIGHRKPYILLLAGLWFSTLMSHVANGYFGGVLIVLPETFKISLFTTLFLCVLNAPGRLRVTAWVLVAMAMLMAVHAILQQKTGVGFAGQTPLWQYRPFRDDFTTRSMFFGIFEDPNDLAQTLVSAIPFTLVLWRRNGFPQFCFAAAVSWVFVLAALATDSRGGWISMAATGGVLLLLLLPRRWLKRGLPLAILGGLTLSPMMGAFMDQSAKDRAVFWGEANYVFRTKPLFGVGKGMFTEYVTGGATAHNAFVLCYTELGLFGYWFWFTLLYICIVGVIRAREALLDVDSDEARWLARLCGVGLASMMGFLASSYFLSRTFVFPLFFLAGILGCVPALAAEMEPSIADRVLIRRKDITLWGTVGTLVSVVYIYISILVINRM